MKSFPWRAFIFLFSFLALTLHHATVALLPADQDLTLYPIDEVEGHPRAMTADGSYVYTVIGRQIAVLSLQNPNGFVELGRAAPLPGTILDIAVKNRIVYGLFNWNGDVNVFLMDFTDPAHPFEIDRYYLDGYPEEIEISGSNAYLDQGYGLTIYDVSTSWEYVTTLSSPSGYSVNHLQVDGDWILATWIDFEGQLYRDSIYLYENVDGDAPRMIGTYTSDLNYSVEAVGISGDLAYVLWDRYEPENNRNRSIFQVIDFSHPGNGGVIGELLLSLDNGGRMFPIANKDILVDHPYVYLRDEDDGRIQQINVSDPSDPRLAAVARSYEFPEDWLIQPPYLFVSSTRGGIEIHRLHPDGRLVRQGDYLDARSSMPIRAEVFGDRLYVLNRKGDLQVYSLAEPLKPRLVSAIENRGTVHGFYSGLLADNGAVYLGDPVGIRIFSMTGSGDLSFKGTFPLYSQRRMAKIGDLLITAGRTNINILDAADSTSPTLLGEWAGGTNVGFIAKDNFIIVALESGRLVKVDIADPYTPIQVANTPLPGKPTTIALDGSLAYVGIADGQFLVFDLDNAEGPELIGGLETSLKEMRILHAEKGLAYLSGQTLDAEPFLPPLYIIDVREGDAPRLAARQFAGSEIFSVSAFGELLYVSGWNEGVRIESLAETSSTVMSPAGGDFHTGNGRVRYVVPAGVFREDTEVVHSELPEILGRHTSFISVGRPFEITAIGLGSGIDVDFEAPVEVIISNVRQGLTAIDGQSLALFRFDGIDWRPVQKSEYDANNNTLQAAIERTGRYIVGGYAEYQVALPAVLAGAAGLDLNIALVEVTQATQNEAGDVPLVAEKRTVARIYVQTNSTAVPNVEIYLHGQRNGQLLPGSPLHSGLWMAPATAERDHIGTSVNFELPVSWTQGPLTLEVKVDPLNSIRETLESNNAESVEVVFHSVPALDVDSFPIEISGRAAPPPKDFISDRLLAMFPLAEVNTRLRPTLQMLDVACNGSDIGLALSNLAAVKIADGAPPSRVYYGYAGCDWGGIGYMAGRVSIGQYEPWIYNRDVMTHEIGHNFGLPHAGCTDDDDPSYPYYNWIGQGLIGVHGFDSASHYVFQPNEHLNNMGYCSWFWDWISDYQYRALFNDQLIHGGSEAKHTEVLLLRLFLDKAGTTTMQPSYILRASETEEDPDSIYRLEWLDVSGNPIDTYGLPVSEIADAPGRMSIVAGVPIPQAGVGSYRVWKNDELIVERALLNNAERPELKLGEPDRGAYLIWEADGLPALIRFTKDGNSWMTLGIDIVESNIHLDQLDRTGQFEVYFADTIGPSLLSYHQ